MSSTILANLDLDKSQHQDKQNQQVSIFKLFTSNSIKNKFQFGIHLCMIFLCLVGTFLIFNEDRLIVKIVLGLFMLVYLIFVTKNKIFQSILLEEVYQQQYQKKYRKAHALDLSNVFQNKQEKSVQSKDRYKLRENQNYRQYLLEIGQQRQRGSSSLTNNLTSSPLQKSITKSIVNVNQNVPQKQSVDDSSTPLQVVRSMSRSVIGSFKNVIDQVKNSVSLNAFKSKQDSSSPINQKQSKRGAKLTNSILIQKDKNSSSQKKGFDIMQGLRINAWKKKQPIEMSSSSSEKIKCLPRTFLAVNFYDENQGKQYNNRFIKSLQNQNIRKNYPNIWQKFKIGLFKQLNELFQKSNKNWTNLIDNVQKYYNLKVIKQVQNKKNVNFQQKVFNKFRQSQIFNGILCFQSFNVFIRQKKIKIKNESQRLLAEQYLTKLFLQREQIDTLLNIYNSNYQLRQKKLKLIRQVPTLIDQRVQPMIQTAQNQSLHAEAKVLCLTMFVNKINVMSDVYSIKMMGIITSKQGANIQIVCQKGSDNIIPHYNLKFRNNLINCQYGANNPLNVLALMFYKIWQQINKNAQYSGSFSKKQDLINFLKKFC